MISELVVELCSTLVLHIVFNSVLDVVSRSPLTATIANTPHQAPVGRPTEKGSKDVYRLVPVFNKWKSSNTSAMGSDSTSFLGTTTYFSAYRRWLRLIRSIPGSLFNAIRAMLVHTSAEHIASTIMVLVGTFETIRRLWGKVFLPILQGTVLYSARCDEDDPSYGTRLESCTDGPTSGV